MNFSYSCRIELSHERKTVAKTHSLSTQKKSDDIYVECKKSKIYMIISSERKHLLHTVEDEHNTETNSAMKKYQHFGNFKQSSTLTRLENSILNSVIIFREFSIMIKMCVKFKNVQALISLVSTTQGKSALNNVKSERTLWRRGEL